MQMKEPGWWDADVLAPHIRLEVAGEAGIPGKHRKQLPPMVKFVYSEQCALSTQVSSYLSSNFLVHLSIQFFMNILKIMKTSMP